MQVHYSVDDLPVFRNAVVTIGTFDGVHNGHRQVIDRLKLEAKQVNGETVIITFHPHPRKVVSSAILGIRLINTLDEKIELLRETGIDHLVVVPFTAIFANQSAADYIKDFLVDKFKPHSIIIGYDHRFGRNRDGDYRLLEKQAPVYNYQLLEIPQHILKDISISSTNIRQAILQGDFTTARALLGYNFFFTGRVVHGNKLGRTLGYPTANLEIENGEKIIPANGIYAVYAQVENETKKHKGMMSIGFRPTINGKTIVIEVNLFDFELDIYDKYLTVYVVKYLREEVRFDNLEALVSQIDQDKIDSIAVL